MVHGRGYGYPSKGSCDGNGAWIAGDSVCYGTPEESRELRHHKNSLSESFLAFFHCSLAMVRKGKGLINAESGTVGLSVKEILW